MENSNNSLLENLKNKKIIIILAGVVILLITLSLLSLLSLFKKPAAQNEQTSTEKQEESSSNQNILKTNLGQPYGLIYGSWAKGGSIIMGMDLSKDVKYELASLPKEIKKVSVISADKLLYIDGVDEKDHGKELSIYNISDKRTQSIYKADLGFGIDDYVISANQRYVAVWEVKLEPDSSILKGGSSRVYSIDITNPNIKNLIYDEIQKGETPVHYPRGITSSGEIFLDTFLPNEASGWGNGMSRSNFNGTTKQDISSMQNGTYGNQPSLSPNGNYLVFAGYDGISGPGTKLINGFKQAALTPNTLEVYDINKNARISLLGSMKEGIFTSVGWDKITGNIIFSLLSKDKDREGVFSYNLQENKIEKIDIGKDKENKILISLFPSGSLLVSHKDGSDTAVGNLGDTYSALDTKFYIVNKKSSYTLKSSDQYMQYIDIVPTSYLTGKPQVLGARTSVVIKPSNSSPRTLQLQSFFFKTDLPEKRVDQQTKPRCIDLAREQCIAMGNTSDVTTDPNNLNDCLVRQRLQNLKTTGVDGKRICMDSPLYLYGNKDQQIEVKIGTNVFSTIPNHNGIFNVVLEDNDKLKIDGRSYESISYDYTPGIRINFPSSGVVVEKGEVENTLSNFAKKLKLNDRETEDLINWGANKITSPFAYVSFYDQPTSKKILPITFNPEPDTYINIVFYLKPLAKKPNFSIPLPDFDLPARKGFTAIEISGFFDR